MRKHWFVSTLFVVAILVGLRVVLAFREAIIVKPVDYTNGNPPFAKPIEARQKFGPSVPDVIRAMGRQRVEDAIGD